MMNLAEFTAVVEHIRRTLAGGKLIRVNEPAPGAVAMTFDVESAEPVLVASIHPRCTTLFTAEAEPPLYTSAKPQRLLNASFVKALEHTVRGFTLTGAALLWPDDRVARLSFHHVDEYGLEKDRVLQLELTGRVAHMFLLTETERVVSSMRRLHRPGTKEFREAMRQIAAGKPLPPPPKPPRPEREEAAAPLKEVLRREREGFARLQAELAGAAARSEPKVRSRQAAALREELALAYQAKSALAVLGPFSLAPAGIREILGRVTSEGFIQRLEERALLDEPVEFNPLVSYLQRLAGSAEKLEQLVAAAEKQPAAKQPPTAPDTAKSRPDAVSARLAKFPHRAKRGRTSGGFDFIVTFSAEGNLAALKAFPAPDNLWFHARDFPGSYVILLTGRRTPEPVDLHEAALAAAAHSKGKGEATVEVCYTKLKYLKKPRSGKAGTILRTRESVLTVRPALFRGLRGELLG